MAQLRNVKSALVGKTEEQARMLVESLGLKFRVYSRDRIIGTEVETRGFVVDRINVRMKEGKVFEVISRG